MCYIGKASLPAQPTGQGAKKRIIFKEVTDLAGQIHAMVQSIITQKSKGNAVIANTIKTKIYLKGIAVDKYTPSSPDDYAVIAKIREVAKEFGITV